MLKTKQPQDSAYARVQLARHPKRPQTNDLLGLLFDEFVELSGDRRFADDSAVITGMALFDSRPVAIVGQQKGRDTQERSLRNFGMSKPEGYRKAMRVMRMAERFDRPVLTFIDTMGAYPGIDAEERGQAEAIATNLLEMARLRVPVIAVVIGEGGSGGALGIGVSDRLLMLENSIYSVISPEGCAAILWKSNEYAQKASEALRLTAHDLLDLGVADKVVPEPDGGAHNDPERLARNLKAALDEALKGVLATDRATMIRSRYAKLRKLGIWSHT